MSSSVSEDESDSEYVPADEEITDDSVSNIIEDAEEKAAMQDLVIENSMGVYVRRNL